MNIIGRTNIGQGRGKSSRSVKDVCGTYISHDQEKDGVQ